FPARGIDPEAPSLARTESEGFWARIVPLIRHIPRAGNEAGRARKGAKYAQTFASRPYSSLPKNLREGGTGETDVRITPEPGPVWADSPRWELASGGLRLPIGL